MWRKLECILLSERNQPEKATSCMIPSVGHSGKGKIMETIKSSAAARRDIGGVHRDIGGVHRWSTENFSGSENTLYDIIMMDTCHHTSVQTH